MFLGGVCFVYACFRADCLVIGFGWLFVLLFVAVSWYLLVLFCIVLIWFLRVLGVLWFFVCGCVMLVGMLCGLGGLVFLVCSL